MPISNEKSSQGNRIMMSLFESVTSSQPQTQILDDDGNEIQTPTDWIEFRKLSLYNQDKHNKDGQFYRQEHITKYLTAKSKMENYNQNAIEWLCRYRDENMQPDEEHAINTQLNRFLKVIGDQKHIAPCYKVNLVKLKLNFWHPKQQNNDGAWPG